MSVLKIINQGNKLTWLAQLSCSNYARKTQSSETLKTSVLRSNFMVQGTMMRHFSSKILKDSFLIKSCSTKHSILNSKVTLLTSNQLPTQSVLKSCQFSTNSSKNSSKTSNATSDSSNEQDASSKLQNPSDWMPIYKFPYVHFIAATNRLKIYQAAFTCLAVPVSTLIPDFSPLVVAYVGISGFITLTAASFFLKDTVGFVYTSKSREDLVKFSTVDFLGKRKDEIINLEDITAFSEMQASPLDKFVTSVRFFNGHKNMKLFHNFGGIYDLSEFIRVFGEER